MSIQLIKRFWLSILLVSAFLAFYKCLPEPLFQDSLSKVVWSEEGKLLAAQVAQDEQWRFPSSKIHSEKYKTATLLFEDRFFHSHPGINPFAIFRAMQQNMRNNRIVSGGSTITQQVIRLSRASPPRTYSEKFIEMILAFRLEFRHSKDEIFKFYAEHAPFGGNVIGVEAASWRYFGRASIDLSWAEACMLAVLPNAPGLMHPGRNRKLLEEKRNRLLERLLDAQIIDSTTYTLAVLEPIPNQPVPIPNKAPHVMAMLPQKGGMLYTTLDADLQDRGLTTAKKYYANLCQNGIHNLAILIAEVKTAEIKMYIGNSDSWDPEQGGQVDVIQAPRSTGSILKPFLYAGAIQNGIIQPQTIIPDVPMRMTGFSPKNFDRKYRGAVQVQDALTASLNVPAVRLLRDYGLPIFHNDLHQLQINSITKSPNYYGLTLVLGGAEANLWELVQAYSELSYGLSYDHRSDNSEQNRYSLSIKENSARVMHVDHPYHNHAVYQVFEMLKEVNRPREYQGWERYESARDVAWKTGTSFGHRDAWAIGVTPEYVVGVWVGNASGEGRPGLTGGQVAAPILFDVFGYLPPTSWFHEPLIEEAQEIHLCAHSGYRASRNCTSTFVQLLPKYAARLAPCVYCTSYWVDEEEEFRVNASCYALDRAIEKKSMVLPPAMEWFYKKYNPFYTGIPPQHPNCVVQQIPDFELIYPEQGSVVFIPRMLDGSTSEMIAEAKHRRVDAILYWHLDDSYLGKTEHEHSLAFIASAGEHTLVITDQSGNSSSVKFSVSTP